jgi:ankyrin repeat protein
VVTETSSAELFDAIRTGDEARAAQLLTAQPALATALNADGLSPLIMALYTNRAATADAVLALRPVDSLSIHEAAAAGVVERLEAILADDPDAANAWSPDGFQPLGLAAFFGREAALDLLLARGGEVNTVARHPFAVNSLHAALAGPRPDLARRLVDAGADVNAAQRSGTTPLHETAFNGSLELTQLLLDHGANPAVSNGQGQTPESVARERGHTEVADLLARQ